MKYIKLSQGKQALVDDEDFEWLSKWKWSYANTGYAKRASKNKTYLMHRIILKTRKGFEVDHINRNKLDNRRENLRNCQRFNNHGNIVATKTNKSGYKGVSWSKARNGWLAQICHNNKHYNLGVYENIMDAARVYNEAAKKLFGKYANINILWQK